MTSRIGGLGKGLRAIFWATGFIITFTDNIASIAMVNDDGMEPNLRRGDLVLVEKLNVRNVRSGQVVQIRNPETERGATDMHLIRRLHSSSDVRYAKFRYLKDNPQSDARDSNDFSRCPDAINIGRAVAVVFPPWRMTILD